MGKGIKVFRNAGDEPEPNARDNREQGANRVGLKLQGIERRQREERGKQTLESIKGELENVYEQKV